MSIRARLAGLRHREQSTSISPEEAHRRLAAREITLLDVREPDEWAAGHAAGACHQPLGSLSPAAVPSGKPVVTVCRSGGRSARAAALLRANGVTVLDLPGGMTAWQRAGLPLVTKGGGEGRVI